MEKKGFVPILSFNNYPTMTSSFIDGSVLKEIGKMISDCGFDYKLFEWYSMMYNKTYHMDCFLDSNMSIEDTKFLERLGSRIAYEKAVRDVTGNEFLAGIGGNLSDLMHNTNIDSDSWYYKKGVRDILSHCDNSLFVYSCGANDLMLQSRCNPWGFMFEFGEKRKQDISYHADIARDPETLDRVICGVENNFEKIKNINPNTNIVAFGTYVHPLFENDRDFIAFKELILKYNERLKELCGDKGVDFVSVYDPINYRRCCQKAVLSSIRSIIDDKFKRSNPYPNINDVSDLECLEDSQDGLGSFLGSLECLKSPISGRSLDDKEFDAVSREMKRGIDGASKARTLKTKQLLLSSNVTRN